MALLDALREMAGGKGRRTGGPVSPGSAVSAGGPADAGLRRRGRVRGRRLITVLLGPLLAGSMLVSTAAVTAGTSPALAASVAQAAPARAATTGSLIAGYLASVRAAANSGGALAASPGYEAWAGPQTADLPAVTRPWYDYKSYCCLTGGSEEVYFNYSANMAGDMEKAVKKVADHLGNVQKWISALSAILYGIIHSHPKVAVIISIVSGLLAAVSMSLPKLAKIIKQILKGKGKHAGFYASAQWNLIAGQLYYQGYGVRYCASSAYSCGPGGPQL